MPFESVAAAESQEEWIERRCRQGRRRRTGPQRHRPRPPSRRRRDGLSGLTREIPLDGRPIDPRVSATAENLREMEFLFPLPEGSHPSLADPEPGKLVVERGFIKGFVDLVVEHDGLVYFADWKSDVLDSYRAGADRATCRGALRAASQAVCACPCQGTGV